MHSDTYDVRVLGSNAPEQLVLGDIARRHKPVSLDVTSNEVDQMFRDDATRDTVLVDLGNGRVGAIGRSSFYMQLAGPKGFGYALHAHRSIRRLLDRDRPIFDASIPLVEAAVQLLTRGGSGVDEELVVRWSDGRVGTAPVADLYRRFAGTLDEQVRVVASEHELLDSVIRNSSDAIGVVGADGVITMANSAMASLFGEVGATFSSAWSEGDRTRLTSALAQAARAPGIAVAVEVRTEIEGATRALRVLLTDLHHDHRVRGVVVNASDHTTLDTMRRRLEHDATHDPLTGLPNRAAFRHAYDDARASRAQGLALLYVDVDRFKSVNDSLGHRAGDELLIAVARRLRACVREPDVVVRLGGDEFVVLLHGVELPAAIALAERILASLVRPIAVSHTQVTVRASIGIVVEDGSLASDDLLRDADVAMYEAKVRGGGQWAVFDERGRLARARRATLERRLARAVAGDDIEVAYQPLVDLAEHRVVGVEALARWTSADGPVAPEEFIALAEETGLIHPLGRAVLSRACDDIAALNRAGLLDHPIELSVNLSARQLGRAQIADELLGTISDAGLDVGLVTLELTESSLVFDGDGCAVLLEQLQRAGARLALDDFGTGYSSLAHLHRYRFDRLKIDRVFVAQLGGTRSATIADSIVALGNALGLEVVAEGIETVDQLHALRARGCSLGQGWLFAPALAISELRSLLESGAGRIHPAGLLSEQG